MRGMILRRVLLCVGTVLAFPTLEPHLPQTIDCPNSDIHVYINQTAVDRSEYTFVDWNAANLQDCIEKCFGNHFCYSIRFDASLDHNCGLYYFAAYNCSNQALTKASTIDYKGGSITLDCIRCPGRGDFVTAPPFSSIGEQTIVSETAVLARGKNIKGTATEITHNSEHEGLTHGEVEGETSKGQKEEGNKEGEKGVEGSGEESSAGSPSGAEKEGEEPNVSTESTLTGSNPSDGSATSPDGSTTVPSAESSDATTENPEEEESAGSSAAPGTEAEGASTAAPSEDGGATSAPTEGETETGSTPSGAEESSTVEGSGEGDEATSPLTGPNGETESIEESSGEGAPRADESASRAPGIMPTESNVEGSGVEGSGEGSPEISLQEEGEAEKVKVDVETTTVWNGHIEQPRECEGALRFVPSSIVDLDTVQLLINSTKANSPAECAKICYEHSCGFAYYEPSTFICQFMANTEDLVDSATCPSDFKDSKYQAEFRTDVASTLTCVVCAKESQVDNSKPALRPVPSPRRGSYPACIISFQAAEGDHSSFPFYKSIQVKGLNECARHCFIGECSQSVYNPKTKECRLGSNPRDTCNNLPLIQKVAAPSEEVLLQCFRCVPEDLIGVKGTVSETTGYREPPTAAESIDEAAATANKEKEQSAAAAATTTTPEPSTEAATEATTEAATEAVTETATEVVSTESTTEEPTTIAGSGDEVDVAEPLPEGVTERPEEETTTATESTTTEEETTPIGGEEVELEEASGEEESSTSSGVIKTTPSGYDSTTASGKKEGEEEEEKATAGGVEGSGEEPAATSSSPESSANRDYEATTAAGAAEKEEGVGGATTAASETTTGEGAEGTTAGGEEAATTAAGEEGTTAAGEKATTAAAEEEGTTAAGEEAATTSAGEEGTTAAGEEAATTVAGEEGTTAVGEEAATTAAGEEGTTAVGEEATTTAAGEEGTTAAGAAEGEEATTAAAEEGASTLSPEEAATSEGPGEMSKAIEANDKPLILASEDLDFGKSCVIKFQSAPFSSRPSSLTAPFEKSFHVDSIELCATRCFQDGCSSAKFEPETKTCHLAYDDKPVCDRTELHLRMKEVTGDTWIHCVNCYPEKSVVNDVLGAPLNKTSAEETEEDKKESMLDKVVGAVSDVAHSVAETVTGQSPDTVLKHGCIVNFQTSLSSEMVESIEFLPPFKTRYAHRCATKCFQEGCAAATFNPNTNECSLGYGKFVKCSNSPLVTTALDVKEKVTIHCMSCIHHKPGDGGVDLVVLSPDDARIHVSESQDVPAEEAEGSGTEEATVPSVAGGESTTEGAEATTASSDEASTVSGNEEGTTASGAEEGSTAAGTVEGSTVSGTEEGSTPSGETSSSESTVGEGSTTAPSTVSAESTVEEPSTVSSVEGSSELNGGSLGEEGSGSFEGPGTGRISEVPLETGADGVQIPAGVNLEVGEGKVQVNGEKEENGKFKPTLPAGFSIDSGLGSVQVDGKMPQTTGEGGKDTGTGTGEKGTATGTAGEGEKPSEAKTDGGSESGAVGKHEGEGEGTESGVEGGESSTTSPSESSTSVEGGESSTGLTTGTEEGEATTASTDDASSSATPSDSSTAVGETSSAGEETVSSTEGHRLIHPAKEFEHTPLHTEGEEIEVGSAETTTGKGEEGVTSTSEDSEATTASKEGEGAGVTPSPKDSEASTSANEEEGVTSSSKDSEATTAAKEGEGVTSSSKDAEATTGHGEEGVTSSSKDSEATTAGEDTTTEEEGPAFVQESPSEAEQKEEGLAIANDDLKHKEGLLEKVLANATPKKPTEASESTTGSTVPAEKPSAAESIDSGLTTVAPIDEEEAGKSSIAPVESSTGATPAATETSTGESSTPEATTSAWNKPAGSGEIDAMAAMDATASMATEDASTTPSSVSEGSESTTVASEASTSAVNDEASTTAAADLQHKEGILEKALAAANPAITTKGGEKVEATTVSATNEDGSSTVEPPFESTVASSTEASAHEGAESTVASSTEGGETTVATEGSEGSEGSSTVAPIDGMAASIDEKTKEEPKEIEEETMLKGEVKENGEKGASAASLDAGSSTVSPSESSSSTSSPLSTTTVPSPADLAKIQHHEKGGAEFGQTGQKGTEPSVDEEVAHKGTGSSLDASTVAPSDTEGSTAAADSDAATGELTTSSSVDGGGLARGETAESTTSSVHETTVESSTGASEVSSTPAVTSEDVGESSTGATEGSSTASSVEGDESSTSSSEGAESSTTTASESIDSEGLLQKALATANPKFTEKTKEDNIATTTVPSPADLAKIQHHEKGGAEFGQTGQKGTEEDEIKSSSISPVEASTSANGVTESLDGGIDHALTAIGGEADATTEPPVQAVKDLLDALASGDFDRALLGKKPNGTDAEKLLKGKTQITEVGTPINQKHEGQTFFEHDHTVDITTLHAIDDSIVTVPSPQGISKDCDGGRLEFQFVPAGSLPRLNVTNDVPARTPADCARKCHETKGCTTAGFIPTPSVEIANGVCLLTSDDEVCISREDAVPQHASVTAFVISCIRCTRCSYTLSHMTLSSSTAKFQHIATVNTIGECAEVCNDKKCVFAQYDATTNTCALSMEATSEDGCHKVEPPLAVKGAYPVRLECVQCRE